MELFVLAISVIVAILASLVYLLYDQIFNVKVEDLSGKHVLITGGSSGIGLSVALEAARQGAHITIIARNKAKLEEAKTSIVKSCRDSINQKITTLSMDVTQNLSSTEKSLNDLEDSVGPVFLLVNCAGSAECAPFLKSTEENYRKMLNLNFMGTVLPTQAIARSMAKRNEGIIVITSSMACLLGIYGMGAYCSSKWALRGFAETIRQELAPHKISVTLCLPPDTDTPGFATENIDKPIETREICQAGGLYHPDDVARKLISDAQKGRFWSTVGITGALLTLGSAGLSPFSTISEVILQVLMAGLVRLIGVFVQRDAASIISSHHDLKTAENEKED